MVNYRPTLCRKCKYFVDNSICKRSVNGKMIEHKINSKSHSSTCKNFEVIELTVEERRIAFKLKRKAASQAKKARVKANKKAKK
jgi:hypothetical protein